MIRRQFQALLLGSHSYRTRLVCGSSARLTLRKYSVSNRISSKMTSNDHKPSPKLYSQMSEDEQFAFLNKHRIPTEAQPFSTERLANLEKLSQKCPDGIPPEEPDGAEWSTCLPYWAEDWGFAIYRTCYDKSIKGSDGTEMQWEKIKEGIERISIKKLEDHAAEGLDPRNALANVRFDWIEDEELLSGANFDTVRENVENLDIMHWKICLMVDHSSAVSIIDVLKSGVWYKQHQVSAEEVTRQNDDDIHDAEMDGRYHFYRVDDSPGATVIEVLRAGVGDTLALPPPELDNESTHSDSFYEKNKKAAFVWAVDGYFKHGEDMMHGNLREERGQEYIGAYKVTLELLFPVFWPNMQDYEFLHMVDHMPRKGQEYYSEIF